MSGQRNGGGGGVRGPTSALTEFLREKNIHIPNANRFARAEPAAEPPAQSTEENAAGPSQPANRRSTRATATTSTPSSSLGKRKKAAPKGASMNFDEEEEDWHSDTAASETAESESASPQASTSRSGRSTGQEGQPENEQAEPDDIWTRVRNGQVTDVSHKAATAGTIDYCPGCTGRFTITGYTVQTASGGLCHKCGPKYNAAMAGGFAVSRSAKTGKATPGKAGGAGPVSAVSSARKPAPKRKKTVIDKPQDKKVLATLQDMCINIISEYIEDVEALGGIGDRNIDTLSKSISKNRRLNDQTVQLFLEPRTENLALYDCSKLTPDSLRTIGVFAPKIHTLNLQQCGQLDNTAFDSWTEKLTCLESLELYGPFLVRKEAWLRFFDHIGDRLKSLKLRETPRFDLDCAKRLVEKCPGLQELGLAQIGPLDGDCLKPLHSLKHLTYLDVSDPGVAVSGIPPKGLADDDVIELLSHIGANLTHLNLGGNAELTDRVILEGILPYCGSLEELRLEGLDQVESDALALLFDSMSARQSPKLTHVDLKRCRKVQDDCLEALVSHSGAVLKVLNLNSCSLLTGSGTPEVMSAQASTNADVEPSTALQLMAKQCPSLQTLDVGFVRSCGLAEIMTLVEHCPNLQTVLVFGCNRIPDYVAAQPGGPNGTTKCKIVGLERVPIISKNVVVQ